MRYMHYRDLWVNGKRPCFVWVRPLEGGKKGKPFFAALGGSFISGGKPEIVTFEDGRRRKRLAVDRFEVCAVSLREIIAHFNRCVELPR